MPDLKREAARRQAGLLESEVRHNAHLVRTILNIIFVAPARA